MPELQCFSEDIGAFILETQNNPQLYVGIITGLNPCFRKLTKKGKAKISLLRSYNKQLSWGSPQENALQYSARLLLITSTLHSFLLLESKITFDSKKLVVEARSISRHVCQLMHLQECQSHQIPAWVAQFGHHLIVPYWKKKAAN